MSIIRSISILTGLALLLVLSAACAPPLISPQPGHPAPPESGESVEDATWVSPGTELSLTLLHTADTWGYMLPCG